MGETAIEDMGAYEGGPKEVVFAVGNFVEQVEGVTEVVARESEESREEPSQKKVVVVGFSEGFE